MKRHYTPFFKKYLSKKIVLISGPRQAGKTTIAKMMAPSFDYLNYDSSDDRGVLREKSWDRKKNLIIFDELHKMSKWKQWLKGVTDTESFPPSFVVTGSARLDSYRKVGDSLAGRFFHYRLHPFDVRELCQLNPHLNSRTVVDKILTYGGFPEPYLENTQEFYGLWKKSHIDIILRQDLLDLESVKNIKQIETLIDLLRTRVGSPISYSSLARDLQASDKTIKVWLGILENLYVIFKISPYSKNIARSILKQPKYYFYDVAQVSNPAARLENLVAASLLKESHFRQDCLGLDWQLNYLAQKGGKEIDFILHEKSHDPILIEVKTSDSSPVSIFKNFALQFKKPRLVQLVLNLKREKTFPDGAEVRKLDNWLVHGY